MGADDRRGQREGSGTGQHQAGGPAGVRRGGGFRRAAEPARAPFGTAASRQGFAVADVLIRWPEVVGEALSGLCHPVRVAYGRGRNLGATLVVEVEGARGPEVEMMAPRIIERVNAFYGYRAITRLSISQTGVAGPGAGFAEAQAGFAGPGAVSPPEPAPEAAERARTLAAGIENAELRTALARMGAYVLSRSREAG